MCVHGYRKAAVGTRVNTHVTEMCVRVRVYCVKIYIKNEMRINIYTYIERVCTYLYLYVCVRIIYACKSV
jgi:hypothetical protein